MKKKATKSQAEAFAAAIADTVDRHVARVIRRTIREGRQAIALAFEPYAEKAVKP